LTGTPNAALREYQRKINLKISTPNFAAQDRKYFVEEYKMMVLYAIGGYPDFSASKILTI
jgi:hypothetical protein